VGRVGPRRRALNIGHPGNLFSSADYNRVMVRKDRKFATSGGTPVASSYGREDLPPELEVPPPGRFPFTRGIHRNMYRERLWTMRQFSGFSTPEETNRRYRYLLGQGQTGLSVAFDLPTLMGYDADHPIAEGEVGKCGAPVSSLEDMEALFDGIPLSEISVSMTINSPACVIWAMYLVVAEKQGASPAQLTGTLQNDILKEYIAQKEYIFPPRPSLRLVTDTIEFGTRHVPRFNPVSISGYHIREAGSTALQELAFTLRDGIEYVDGALGRGLAIDDFAPRLSFFFNAHSDFFEEIAKYRAARTLWAQIMRDRYGAKDERSMKLRFHAQMAGCSLTWQQPYNNVARTAIEALAAVLGGAQSLHTNSLDEAYALPSEEAATLALRTQQVIAFESGVTSAPDPFGGSYFVERLTLDLEEGAREYFRKIDEMGGMVAAIERGYPQSEIAAASYAYQKNVESGEAVIVGVNRFQNDSFPEGGAPRILRIDPVTGDRQREKLRILRQGRRNFEVEALLKELRHAAEQSQNLMPFLIAAVRAYATLGEICAALRDVFGTWEERAVV
jgi:methylmalonyl-CoA mutase N-terminal domain/subunit